MRSLAGAALLSALVSFLASDAPRAQALAGSFGRLATSAPAPPCTDPGDAANLPPGFQDEPLAGSWNQAVGLAFHPDGRLFVWEKGGRVWTVDNGTKAPVPLIDLSAEVGNWADHGLLGFALDPAFDVNHRIYLLYVVDRHHVLEFGTPGYDPATDEYFSNTIGRVTRYTVSSAGGFQSVLPGSRQVLLGTSIDNGIPICDASYGTGALVFGEDGSLLVGCGDAANGVGTTDCFEDGIITAKEDVGVLRAQLVDSFNGKILRIRPDNGSGYPSNPFYDSRAPKAPRSLVWTLGLRQHFRFTLRPGSGSSEPADGDPGTLYLGDVGSSFREELNVVPGSALNLGWPIYEGMELNSIVSWDPAAPNLDAPNPLFGLEIPGLGTCAQEWLTFHDLLVQDALAPSWLNPCDPSQALPASLPLFAHHRPALDWQHFVPDTRVKTFDARGAADWAALGDVGAPVTGDAFAGNCSVGGVWYNHTSFPPEYQGRYFHADYAGGWIRSLGFDANDQLLDVSEFAQTGAVVALAVHPLNGDLYYINYNDEGASRVRRIRYAPLADQPVAEVAVSVPFGPAPLLTQLDASASSDPQSGSLTYRWSFADGQPYGIFPQTRRTLPAEDITLSGQIVAKLDELDPPFSMGAGNLNPEVIRDGSRPLAGTRNTLLQYDTYHEDGTGTPDKGADDWIGYVFPTARVLHGLLFQEGQRQIAPFGGWFAGLEVQVRDPQTGAWSAVDAIVSNPVYSGPDAPADMLGYQTFELAFAPVLADGIRLYGTPGGTGQFVSVAELRALADPAHPPIAPKNVAVNLVVEDPQGLSDCSTVTVSLNNTPPSVQITAPLDGASYPGDAVTTVPLSAIVSDAEHALAKLDCEWQAILYHDNHGHPDPVSATCQGQATLVPHEQDPGDALYYEMRLIVRDPLGLETVRSVHLYPAEDCNFNGVADADDIALGTSLDLDRDLIPDECQADCNANGVHDLFDILLGTSLDADQDQVPDECP